MSFEAASQRNTGAASHAPPSDNRRQGRFVLRALYGQPHTGRLYSQESLQPLQAQASYSRDSKGYVHRPLSHQNKVCQADLRIRDCRRKAEYRPHQWCQPQVSEAPFPSWTDSSQAFSAPGLPFFHRQACQHVCGDICPERFPRHPALRIPFCFREHPCSHGFQGLQCFYFLPWPAAEYAPFPVLQPTAPQPQLPSPHVPQPRLLLLPVLLRRGFFLPQPLPQPQRAFFPLLCEQPPPPAFQPVLPAFSLPPAPRLLLPALFPYVQHVPDGAVLRIPLRRDAP